MSCGFDIEFNPLTGEFELVKKDNFSYFKIIDDCCKHIQENQEMIVDYCFELDGTLLLDGILIVIDL